MLSPSNKKLGIWVGLAALAAVVGSLSWGTFSKAEARDKPMVKISLRGSGSTVWIIRDDETGCHYMTNVKQGGITPRLKPDGTIYCD